MKLLKSKKAFTLLEVVISIALIAAIALPLLSIFVQSIKTDRAASDVLNANYISQGYIERLDAETYSSALTSLPNHQESGAYYLSASIKPYGTVNGLFDTACDYAHFVCYDNEKLLVVMPDGQWRMFSSVPNNMAIITGGGAYTFTVESITVLAGSMTYNNCAVIINAMKKVSSSEFGITLDNNCAAVVYCRSTAVSDITVAGSSETYTDMIVGDKSLIHVTTRVFDTADSSDPVASAESYINITNWLSS